MSAAKSRVSKAHDSKREELSSVEETSAKKAARERTVTVVAKASGKTQEAVITELGKLKLDLTSTIDGISGALVTNISELKTVQEAIAAEKATLEAVHGIKAAADSLEALQAANEEEKQAHAEVMTGARAAWDAEKKAHDKAVAEAKKELEVTRRREQEAYDYEIAKKRQTSEDTWQQEMAQRRRSFADELAEQVASIEAREKVVAEKEAEIEALRTKVAQAEASTDAEVKKSVAIATSSLKKDLTHEFTIKELEYKGLLNVKTMELGQKDSRIKELEGQVKALDENYKAASAKVVDVATRAIDGASRQQTVVQVPAAEPVDSKRGR